MTDQGKKAVFGWAMYDWANSAFATTVMAAFFPIFFKQYWSTGTDPTISSANLGLANSAASAFIAIVAPLLGAIADRGHSKKKFLFFFTGIGIFMTCYFYFIPRGGWQIAAAVYVLAMVGYSGSFIFYDALLTTVASEEETDFVSSLGFALGYLGGGILFALNVWMTLKPGTFGLPSAGEGIRVSFLTVGVWWALFSLPLLFLVKEARRPRERTISRVIQEGLSQLRGTFREIRHLKVIILFLAAYWFYIDGVNTVIVMALDYGLAIGLKSDDLIVALLMVQFIGFPSAIAFGKIGEKIGSKTAIMIGITVYLFITAYGVSISSKNEFFVMACIIGLVQGGVQALSRALYARIIPVEKSAEYFGFYNMMSRFATIKGPLLIAGTIYLLRHLGYSGMLVSRMSILSVSILFMIGGIFLYFVDEGRGKEEAKYLQKVSDLLRDE
jgi:UMF1 family MFS transporter